MLLNLHILLTTPVVRTPRVRQVEGLFDITPAQRATHNIHHHFSTPEPWNIGVIVGPSGAGKTSLARHAWPNHIVDHFPWPSDRSILDGFPPTLGIREITTLLCSVGFSSPPDWLRPFHALSNGQQFRVHLARTLAEKPDLAVIDEFTSVVDRTAARIGSAAIAKTVRRLNKKLIALTCHYDVLDWLQPDWVYEPHYTRLLLNQSPDRESLWRRPPINLQIIRVHRSAWRLFKAHHYLTAKLHPSSRCYLALASFPGEHPLPAAFVAALPFPHPLRPAWREHRCVCLPDFQGVGIGNALSEFVADRYVKAGNVYFSTTSHPGMIRHRTKSPLWRLTRRPGFVTPHRGFYGRAVIDSADRLTAGFEYVGSFR